MDAIGKFVDQIGGKDFYRVEIFDGAVCAVEKFKDECLRDPEDAALLENGEWLVIDDKPDPPGRSFRVECGTVSIGLSDVIWQAHGKYSGDELETHALDRQALEDIAVGKNPFEEVE